MARFATLPALLAAVMTSATPGNAQELQLSLSVQQQTIVAPNPIRATLQFHNSGKETLWLYQPVGDISQISQGNPLDLEENEPGPGQTSGGPTLAIHLSPVNPQSAGESAQAARGSVILTPGFPHPKLIALKSGSSHQERVLIRVKAAQNSTGGDHIAWGRYRCAVTYSARYSNQDELARNLGINLWHEQVRSNEVTLDLQPPTAQGSMEGTVLDSLRREFSGTLVTLSNEDEEPLNQVYTDAQGRFSFSHLPLGVYWITARRMGSTEDNTVFRHVELATESPQATVQLMMIAPDNYESKQLLHKPVLFQIADSSGHPLSEVKLVIIRSTGTITEKVKAETNAEGYAVVNLLPGQNFLTMRRRGCRPEDRRADVAAGGGVDGFKLEYDCSGK